MRHFGSVYLAVALAIPLGDNCSDFSDNQFTTIASAGVPPGCRGSLLLPVLYLLVFVLCVLLSATVHWRTARQFTLLTGSYVIYAAWGWWFPLVLLASTTVNFCVGTLLRRKPSQAVLALEIVFNLLLLGSFKYLPSIAAGLPLSSLEKLAHIALPLGISFWTFQSMSYLFDLYREEELDPSFVEFALYMAFFPIVISGPICRLPDMLWQFRSEQLTSGASIGRGTLRIATGVLMMQVAKLLGQGIFGGDGITSGFDRVTRWSGPDALVLAIGFGLQLFFDFAGYSHIAIGAAQMLGISVPENFDRPFASATPSIFWTRWHMSLSFWIRDYVFIPMATLRREMWWRNLMLVVSMMLFGLWHKATLLFILWGFYHGVLLLLHRQAQALERRSDWDPPEPLWSVLSWALTMVLISLGWILFRANSLEQAKKMFAALVTPGSYITPSLDAKLYLLVTGTIVVYAAVIWCRDLLDTERVEHRGLLSVLAVNRWYWVPALYALALIFILLANLSQPGGAAPLMYRRF